MLRSRPFRSLNAARSPRFSSLEGFTPTLLLVVPSSATQRLLSVAARRPLPTRQRQRPDPTQHVGEQPAVEVPLGQQQPVVAGMLDSRPPVFIKRCCKLVSDQFLIGRDAATGYRGCRPARWAIMGESPIAAAARPRQSPGEKGTSPLATPSRGVARPQHAY